MSGKFGEVRPAAGTGGGGFPLFTLALLTFFDLSLSALLAAGAAGSGADSELAEFARDFRTWCFLGDPATGRIDWFFPFSLAGESLFLGGIVAAVWGKDLRRILSRGAKRWLPPVGAALIVIACADAALASVGGFRGKWGGAERPAFPGVALRTGIPFPDLELIDQDGAPLRLPDPDGRILLVTSFYAHCLASCPAILAQLRAISDSLAPDQRVRFRIVAVTLDPERDTPAALRERMGALELDPGVFRLATGEPARVEKALDRLGMTRARDDSAGVIRHANAILAVDAEGRIAYRFSIGETQAEWNLEAVRELIGEAEARSATRAAEGPGV